MEVDADLFNEAVVKEKPRGGVDATAGREETDNAVPLFVDPSQNECREARAEDSGVNGPRGDRPRSPAGDV